MSYRILSFTPKTSTMTLDIMIGKNWGGADFVQMHSRKRVRLRYAEGSCNREKAVIAI